MSKKILNIELKIVLFLFPATVILVGMDVSSEWLANYIYRNTAELFLASIR